MQRSKPVGGTTIERTTRQRRVGDQPPSDRAPTFGLDREGAKVRLEKRRQRDLRWLEEALAEDEDDVDMVDDEAQAET